MAESGRFENSDTIADGYALRMRGCAAGRPGWGIDVSDPSDSDPVPGTRWLKGLGAGVKAFRAMPRGLPGPPSCAVPHPRAGGFCEVCSPCAMPDMAPNHTPQNQSSPQTMKGAVGFIRRSGPIVIRCPAALSASAERQARLPRRDPGPAMLIVLPQTHPSAPSPTQGKAAWPR